MKSFHYLTWIVALALAAWVLNQLPFGALLQSIAGLSLLQWIVWVLLNLAVIFLFTGRWLVLTRAMHLSVGFLQLLRVRQAGQVISFVTPGPQFGGEAFQVYWLWKRYVVPGHAALLAVGLDRFYELWINFAVLLLAVLALLASASVEFVDWESVAGILLGLILMLWVSGWFLLRQPQRIAGWIRRLTTPWQHHSRLSRLDTHWRQLNDSLRQIMDGHRPALWSALSLSLLGWAGMIAEFWLLLTFINVTPDLTEFVFLFVVIRLAFLLPLPGGIGSVEAAMFWAFQALELPLAAAAGLIMLMRMRDVVILLAGAVVLPGIRSPAVLAERE